MYERWLHATMAGPVRGIHSSPSKRHRNHAESGGSTAALQIWYQGSPRAQASLSGRYPSMSFHATGRSPAAASSFTVSPITNGYRPSSRLFCHVPPMT